METREFDPAAFDTLLATSLRDTERTAHDTLLLTFDPAAEHALRDIAARSAHASKRFLVRVEDGQVLAEISVPDAEVGLLDEFALRAETADLRVLERLLDEPQAA